MKTITMPRILSIALMTGGLASAKAECRDECSPTGSTASNPACTANYCDVYLPGGALYSRCTPGAAGHNWATGECKAACGLCPSPPPAPTPPAPTPNGPFPPACQDECSPTGSPNTFSFPSLCTATYCDQYKPGGALYSRCTPGAAGHNWATGECKAACGLCPSPPPSPPSPPSSIGAKGDPHLSLPHGGKADFRGEDKTIYNFLSAKDLSLNVMTQLADFELHPANSPYHKDVHGSFLTQAHITARTSTGKMVRVSFWADKIGPGNVGFANGTVGGETFKLGVHMNRVVDDVKISVNYSSLIFVAPEFKIVVSPSKFRLERNVVGLHHRLDVQIKARVNETEFASAPHGIIGQAWDGDGMAIDGAKDVFPTSGEFTTYAMAEGAIEGVPSDYKMASKYSTDFKFSRFDLAKAAPRNIKGLNPPSRVQEVAGDFAGSTEYNFTSS